MGTGAGATPVDESVWLLATPGSISEMASIEARMPSPMPVLRPVARLSRASISAVRSLVGAWTTSAKLLNATIPNRVVVDWLLMNEAAAVSAACSRLGGMSVEHMLPETSIVRMMVVWFVGTATTATGRAMAKTRAARAATNSANGRWRRSRDDPGSASRTRARLE